jgi:hypothetical protein
MTARAPFGRLSCHALFDDQIAQKGEADVLFDWDRAGEPCGRGLW